MALSNYPVTRIREYAEENDLQFTYGREDFQNLLGDAEKVAKVLYMDPITGEGLFTTQGLFERKRYSTMITYACKSSLAENYEQKYDRYLAELSDELDAIIKDLSCNYQITFTVYRTSEIINKFDVNVDGISAQITFTLD